MIVPTLGLETSSSSPRMAYLFYIWDTLSLGERMVHIDHDNRSKDTSCRRPNV